jgi:telomere length regulation protein
MDFLTAVSTKKVKASEPSLQEIKSPSVQDAVHVDSASSALEALRSQPSQETVTSSLKYMTSAGFSLLLPEPLNASIAHQLVNDTLLHYWRPLRQSSQSKQFAKILRNPTGLGHIITRLRSLIADSRQKKSPGETQDQADNIEDLLEVLDAALSADSTSNLVLQDVQTHCKNDAQKKMIWREYLSQIASGRLISVVAEAEDVLKSKGTARTASWLADGNVFADWLGRNIAAVLKDPNMHEERQYALVEFCSKTLSLGYTGQFTFEEYRITSLTFGLDRIVGALASTLIALDSSKLLADCVSRLKPFEQRKYLNALIAFSLKQYFSSDIVHHNEEPASASKTISGAASLFHSLVKGNEGLKDHLVSILTRSTIPALDDSLAARRSLMAALAQDEGQSIFCSSSSDHADVR